MATKDSKKIKGSSTKRLSSSGEPKKKKSWQEQLLPLTLVLMVLGLVLIFAALFDMFIWDAPIPQFFLGGLLVLVSFVASNALQKQWNLAAGWLLLGIAFGLWVIWFDTIWRVLAYLLGGAGLFLIGKEFMQRYWQQQGRKAKKKKR